MDRETNKIPKNISVRNSVCVCVSVCSDWMHTQIGTCDGMGKIHFEMFKINFNKFINNLQFLSAESKWEIPNKPHTI